MKKRGIRIRKGLYCIVDGYFIQFDSLSWYRIRFFYKRKDRNQKGGKRSAGGAG